MAAAPSVCLTPVPAQQAGEPLSRHNGPHPKWEMRDGLDPSKEGSLCALGTALQPSGRCDLREGDWWLL